MIKIVYSINGGDEVTVGKDTPAGASEAIQAMTTLWISLLDTATGSVYMKSVDANELEHEFMGTLD